MKKLVLIASLLFSMGVQAQTTWVDGQDTKMTSDQGRGVTNWKDHYQYSMNSSAQTSGFLKDRMNTLKGSLSRATYARLYADITYLIASYGLSKASWVNGADPAAPANDPNRALLNWTAHHDYVLKTAGYENASTLVMDRMNALGKVLSKEDYARLYADCSILLVNFSRMK